MPNVRADALSTRALNRALLARQLLLERHLLPAELVIEHLVGMQAQVPASPYVGLWTRLDGFDPAELSTLLTERRVVRVVLMRSTIHLVTARDCLTLRPVVQRVLERAFTGARGRALAGLDLAQVAAAGKALVDATPLGWTELGARLAERWPGRDPEALWQTVRARVALVQPPPRGLWGRGGLAVHTSAESWLGEPPSTDATPDEILLRYLAAFGPATVRDAQAWSGLSGLASAFARLRPQLVTMRGPGGAELFDVPDGPRPDPDTQAPPRFLPEFDNLLISHADRSRIVSAEMRGLLFGPSILVNGMAAGAWTLERWRGSAAIIVETPAPLAKGDRVGLEEEGARLLSFLAPDERAMGVKFVVA